MKILKDLLVCVLLSTCVAFCLSLVRLVRDTDTTVKAVPAEIAATPPPRNDPMTRTRDTARKFASVEGPHDARGRVSVAKLWEPAVPR